MKRLLALVLPLTLPLALVLGACSDDGDGSDADSDDPTIETDADGGGEVPNPCTLLAKSELSFLLDGDPGEGTEQGPVPDQRKICTYETGVILSVEIAANWDATLGVIRDMSGADALQDVPGIGEAAVWQATGGESGQFLARRDDYFVGITVSSGGQTVGQFVAEAMLAAL